MLMYPEADIPVVTVSLHSSLDVDVSMKIGAALAPLRDKGILVILGSGYSFHNLKALFHPSKETYQASSQFNEWLKETMLGDDYLEKLVHWEQVPGARMAHPREEHLLPLFMTAAAGGGGGDGSTNTTQLIYNVDASKGEHAVSGYLFQ